MPHSLTQEIGFVADALKHEERLLELLAEKITAPIRREIQQLVSSLSGLLLVADFALTGDAEAVRAGIEETHERALQALAA